MIACFIFGGCVGWFVGRVSKIGAYEAYHDRTVLYALIGCITWGPLALWEIFR